MPRGRRGLAGILSLIAIMLVAGWTETAAAQSRGNPRAAAPPPTGHQNEAIDLNEGKSAAELYQAGCAVCHQSMAGLVKDRRPNELTGFLRQHYTTSVQHAQMLSAFLMANPRAAAPAAATPARATPPAARAAPEAEPAPRRRPQPSQEAARPPEPREPAAKRKPPERAAPPAETAAAAPETPPADAPEAPAAEAAAPEPEAPAPPPPPEIPL